MVNYGDTDSIAQLLEPDTNAGFSDALTTRIESMREVVSRLIDERTGRSFGTVGTSETRQVLVADNDAVGCRSLPVRSRR
jgi:hypothetical protein